MNLDTLAETVLSEAGLVALLLLVAVVVLYRRNIKLQDKFVDAVNSNTAVLERLATLLGSPRA